VYARSSALQQARIMGSDAARALIAHAGTPPPVVDDSAVELEVDRARMCSDPRIAGPAQRTAASWARALQCVATRGATVPARSAMTRGFTIGNWTRCMRPGRAQQERACCQSSCFMLDAMQPCSFV
jgi:hypothetical protein